MQTLGTSCIYATYFDNCIVPACLLPFLLRLILLSCILFDRFSVAHQCFLQLSSVFFSSAIHLASVCIDLLDLWYTHLQFIFISGFQIFFCITYQVQFVNQYV